MTRLLFKMDTETIENDNFRKVIFTGCNLQLVLMSLNPGEDIGVEKHDKVDQFFRVEEGSGVFVIGNTSYKIKDDDAFIAPTGMYHNVINTSRNSRLKLYTIYSPPEHPDGTVQKEKTRMLDCNCGRR